MATTSIGSSGVTFPDATTLATAASVIPGTKGQVFTSSGTFTIPTGVTALKVYVTGGGGGGTNGGAAAGGTGGNSTVASGTQSITTITGNGGGGGAAYSGGGGGSPTSGTLNLIGQVGIGGDNIVGYAGSSWWGQNGGYCSGGSQASQAGTLGGGGGCWGGQGGTGGGGGTAIKWLTGLTPGATLAVTIGGGGGQNGSASPGGSGVVVFEW